MGFLIGAAGGMLSGVIFYKAMEGLLDGIVLVFTLGLVDDAETPNLQAATILEMGLIGAAAGTLYGLLIPRQKVVYLNQQTTLSFHPAVFQVQGNPGAGLTLRINFH
jgi:hypothetical protein